MKIPNRIHLQIENTNISYVREALVDDLLRNVLDSAYHVHGDEGDESDYLCKLVNDFREEIK